MTYTGPVADLHVHTEYSALDGESKCHEVMARAAALGIPAVAITDHRTCFPAGTHVRMADGSERPIEEIRLREWVLTAEGRAGQVRQLMTREAPGLMRLVLWGHQHLTATPDHPVLTKRGYVPVGELSGDDWVCLPRYMPETVAAVYPPALVSNPTHRLSASRRFAPSPTTGAVIRVDAKPLPEKIDLTLDIGRLIGFFMAEGSCDESQVVWTFSIDERDTLAAETIKILEEHLGLNPRLVPVSKKNVVRVVLYGRNWSRLFSVLCGNGAGYKRLHPSLCSGPDPFLDGVLSGWLAGDGHERRGVVTGTTISHDLALGMFDIAQAIGYAPSISRRPPRPGRQPRWDVTVPIAVANSYRLIQEEHRVWRRVRRTEEVPGTFEVYNLSVAGDESYVAEGIGVHNCAGHPQFQFEADRAGIKPILGLEADFQPDRLIRPASGDAEGQKRLNRGRHLVLLAQDNQGLRDLWAASSEAYATGFYGSARVDWDLLERYGSHLIATTACLGGVISDPLWSGRYEEALGTFGRLKDIFGDRLYLEVQANDIPKQAILNQRLAALSEASGTPLIVSSDAHYPSEEEEELHRIWMMCQAGGGKDGYWNFSPMLSRDRTRELMLAQGLSQQVIDRAMATTMEVADRCSARFGAQFEPPVFGASADDDARQLLAMCRANWGLVEHMPRQRDYLDRLEYEFQVVAEKKMAGCYLMTEELTTWVRSQGGLVGPGRGSAAGSLMSYLLEITSVDPLEARLLFERFLTPGRKSLPDFDLDFASSWRPRVQGHAAERYGEGHVVRVGTIMRYGIRGILNKLFSVLKDKLPAEATGDGKRISGIIEEAEMGTAGLGLPLDEIMAEESLRPYIARYESVFDVAVELCGRVYAYGKHPAGLLISPNVPLTGVMPTRSPAGELPVGEWDYRVYDDMGIFKLDALTLRTMDTVQEAIRLVSRRTGRTLDPRHWTRQHLDPQVWDAIGTGLTDGMFQIETTLCQAYCQRHGPRELAELADLTTYIRPGPRNSGATETYLRRRAGLEEVTYPHPLLEDTLQYSQGVFLYQEQVMAACAVMAGYSQLAQDGVRKILGKKLTDKVAAAGEEFVRCGRERGHDEEMLRELWATMAEFGRYAFNRAHGYSYAVLTYWTAWLMVHYPVEMLTAILTTLDDKDKTKRMARFAMEARRRGIAVLPPDVRFCGSDFTIEGLAIRYGLSAIKGVGPAAVTAVRRGQPYGSLEDFRSRAGADAGVLYALAQAGALDPLVTSRRGLVRLIEAERAGDTVRCTWKGPDGSGPGGLPCTYDWDHEPQPEPRISPATGKPLKVYVKPPPKRCTTGCRRYTPPRMLDITTVPEYTAAELFRQDWEVYGTWMSEAPFAQLDEMVPGLRADARTIALMLQGAPEGTYPLAAVYGGADTTLTRAGNAMWWVRLVTEPAVFRLACFAPRDDDDPDIPLRLKALKPGMLVSAQVTRRSYDAGKGRRMGWRLADICQAGG